MAIITKTRAELPPPLRFPLQHGIAHARAVAVVRNLQRNSLTVDTSVEHLGLYADRVERLRRAAVDTERCARDPDYSRRQVGRGLVDEGRERGRPA